MRSMFLGLSLKNEEEEEEKQAEARRPSSSISSRPQKKPTREGLRRHLEFMSKLIFTTDT